MAKTILMTQLNPTHPQVRECGLFLSDRRVKIKTVRMTLESLRNLADWAESTGRSERLWQWSDDDCNAYRLHERATGAPSRIRSAEDILRLLHTYGALLKGGGLNVVIPPTRVGQSQGELTTPVIPPDVFWPLVQACWKYVDVFAPNLLDARDEIMATDERSASEAPRTTARIIETKLAAWLSRPDAFVPQHVRTSGRGAGGSINWSSVGQQACGNVGIFHTTRGQVRQELVLAAVADGVPIRPGTTRIRPVDVERSAGGRGPWCAGFDRSLVSRELTNTRNAIYIFVGLMTMMRDSELQGIPVGALGMRFGAPVVHSKVHKSRQGGGQPDSWWISEPVVQAIKIAERITRDPARLFGSVHKGKQVELVGLDVSEQLLRFVTWVNDHSTEMGLDPIPEFHIAPHMFRRTMAIITANEPDGEIALGITLKHNSTRALANSITSGYAAATPAWAREFDHQAKNAAAGELMSDWAKRAQGRPVARGPGAQTYLTGLDTIGQQADAHQVHLGDERLLRDLLRDEFSTIRLGTLNHCLGDVEKAECLRGLTDEARAAGPVPSMCKPAQCRNSVITEAHMPIWICEEEELLKRLQDRRMAKPHKERLKAQLDDVRKITQQEAK